jgi:hypothetical protein
MRSSRHLGWWEMNLKRESWKSVEWQVEVAPKLSSVNHSRGTYIFPISTPSAIYTVLGVWAGWDWISIRSEPIVPWHMSCVWVLKWGGMSGYDIEDIDNMFGPTFDFKNLHIISIQGIKLIKFLAILMVSNFLHGKMLHFALCFSRSGAEFLKWSDMGASTVFYPPGMSRIEVTWIF